MKVKDKIKNRLDELKIQEIRSLSAFMDKMQEMRGKKRKSGQNTEKPYEKALEILQKKPLRSTDIIESRSERI